MTNIACIVLAAGGSVRLGQPKQLLFYEGQTLIRRAVEAALGAGCSPVIAVLGATAANCATALEDLPVELAINANWPKGMGGSLAVGIKALGERGGGVIVTVCDQLHVTSGVLQALKAAQQKAQARLVASDYAGTLGVPALFDRTFYGELAQLEGDQGARRLLQRYRQEVLAVPLPSGAIDIDTLADCTRFGVGEDQPSVALR